MEKFVVAFSLISLLIFLGTLRKFVLSTFVIYSEIYFMIKDDIISKNSPAEIESTLMNLIKEGFKALLVFLISCIPFMISIYFFMSIVNKNYLGNDPIITITNTIYLGLLFLFFISWSMFIFMITKYVKELYLRIPYDLRLEKNKEDESE